MRNRVLSIGVIFVILSFASAAEAQSISGGSSSPGGSNTQIQYNNNGSFGGDSGFTTNGSGAEAINTSLAIGGALVGTDALTVVGTEDHTAAFAATANTATCGVCLVTSVAIPGGGVANAIKSGLQNNFTLTGNANNDTGSNDNLGFYTYTNNNTTGTLANLKGMEAGLYNATGTVTVGRSFFTNVSNQGGTYTKLILFSGTVTANTGTITEADWLFCGSTPIPGTVLAQHCVNNQDPLKDIISNGPVNFSGLETNSGGVVNSTPAAVSFSPYSMTGAVFTGGSGTTTLPYVLLQPSGATAVTNWATTGTLIGINAPSAYTGSILDVRVNGSASPALVLTAAGALSISSTFTAGSTNGIGWATRAKCLSPVDSVIECTNNAGTGFLGLKLGGLTSGFPYIKVNGAALSFRVGDDTADTAISAASMTSSAAFISAGATPTLTGTCTTASQTGGNTAGTFTATCVAQTVIVTFATTAPTGWNCNAHDQTTVTDVLNQTGSSATSCTLTGTTVALDRISFDARAF